MIDAISKVLILVIAIYLVIRITGFIMGGGGK